MKKYIKIFDNAIEYKTLGNFIRYVNTVDFQDAKVGDGVVNKTIRNTFTFPLNNHGKSFTTVHWNNYLWYALNTYIKKYASEFRHVEWKFLETIEVLKYEEGGFYREHVDDFRENPRTLSGIFLMNNDYEGGELCFNLENEQIIIETLPNRLILWPSNFCFPHEVKPVKKGIRYSLVTWAR